MKRNNLACDVFPVAMFLLRLRLPDMHCAVQWSRGVGVGVLILSLVHIRSYFPPCAGRWVTAWTAGPPPPFPYKVSHPPSPALLSPPCLTPADTTPLPLVSRNLPQACRVGGATLSHLAISPEGAGWPAESCLVAWPVALLLLALGQLRLIH